MIRRPQPLTAPKSRRYICLRFTDAQALAEKTAALHAEQVARIKALDLVSVAEAKEQIAKETAETQRQALLLQGETRTLWLLKRHEPVAMALYAWCWQVERDLAATMRAEGREAPTFGEWRSVKTLPAAAVLGLLWHDLDFELEAAPPTKLAGGGWDFAAYGEAVLGELLDAEEGGLDEALVVELGWSALGKAAGTYLGLADEQEKADFLGVRRALASGQPSA